MSSWPLLALAVLALAGGRPSPACAEPAPSTSIVRIALGAENEERRPVALPTDPGDTVEIDFPWPVEDWAGRGFTPDIEKFAGDFVIEANRGDRRIFVTPVAAQAHRVLHVVLAQPGGDSRSLTLEFIPAPADLAWRKVVFASAPSPEVAGVPVSLSPHPPRTPWREASAEAEIGLLRTLRLMLNTTADGARRIAAANPALEFSSFGGEPRSFGDFAVLNRFALRDATTDTLGVCVSVANHSGRRLLFDPSSWVIRAGSRVFPIRTADFANELEPGQTAPAFLLVTRGPNGEPNRLLPDNELRVSVVAAAAVNPRPVTRMPLKGLEPYE
jgi:hypothetical protein